MSAARRRRLDPDAVDALLAKTAPPADIKRHPLSSGDSSLQWAIDTGHIKIPPPSARSQTSVKTEDPPGRRRP